RSYWLRMRLASATATPIISASFSTPGTVDVRKVDALGGGALEVGECCRKFMEVRIRVAEIAGDRFGRFAQLVLVGVVHDEAKFLLRDIGPSPVLVVLGQEHAPDQWPQLLIA